MTIGPHLLGRNREHDPRSWNYRVTAPTVVTFPGVIHTLAAPPLDQGDIGSCEGNTAAEFLNCGKAIRNRQAFWVGRGAPPTKGFNTRKYLAEINAVTLYEAATRLDNDDIPGTYPPIDTGTSGVGVAKAMKQYGAIDEYGWTFTFKDFMSVLQLQPVMLGTNWYESMMEVTNRGFVVGPGVGAEPAGGHAFLAFAYSSRRDAVGCTNHWTNDDGTPWGIQIGQHRGCFWITTEFLEQLLIREQGESLVPKLK